MKPANIRNRWNLSGFFTAFFTLALTLIFTQRAISAPFSASMLITATPFAIIFGALAFGIIALFFLHRAQVERKKADEQAKSQMINMRASIDNYEILLAGLPQIIVIWSQSNTQPDIHGQREIIFNNHYSLNNVTNYNKWLNTKDATRLKQLVNNLRADAKVFDINLKNLDGNDLRISGHILGGQVALRIRRFNAKEEDNKTDISQIANVANIENAKTIIALLDLPAFVKNKNNKIVFSNSAYIKIEKTNHTENHSVNLVEIENGYIGYLEPKKSIKTNNNVFEYINAVSTPMVIFDKNQKLQHFNKAFSELWQFDEKWLKSGIDEKAMLNRMHTQGQLPSKVNYREWRDEHLAAYSLNATRIRDWFLPNSKTIKVTAVPISQNQGVIYIYEDISNQLAFETKHNALVSVQNETINALSEGVAVFGTNARLTLSNKSLSQMWKLPMNELGEHPHIEQIAKSCNKNMPEDGEIIWNKLKQSIIDLNPMRSDKSERLKLADGRLIDYAITRLPDGQSMLTFIDVTQSASYEGVLKERNDALVAADKMKDAFVKNVSYELRSPLTNIIGFADMLASETAGKLNEKQRSYSDYIRSSSQTLGVLIDNVLDLANADAGILELNIEIQDIAELVERAKAGLVGNFQSLDSETPINIVVDIEENLPNFYADGTRIVQVLYNLLSNATRFSDAGSQINLNISTRQNRIIFMIEDEGIGISDEMKASLFSRFEGGGKGKNQKGAGLGLAIVKTFVNLHSGTVTLESRQPKGTRVIVSIPLNCQQLMSG